MTLITTGELLDRIHCADANEVNEIITAVTERFRKIWSEWDLLVISCEGRTPENHIKTLEQTIRIMATAAKDTLL